MKNKTEEGTRQIDVRGIYRFGKVIDVQTPDDLIKAGIYVSPKAVEATWGKEAGIIYQDHFAARIRNKMQKAASGR